MRGQLFGSALPNLKRACAARCGVWRVLEPCKCERAAVRETLRSRVCLPSLVMPVFILALWCCRRRIVPLTRAQEQLSTIARAQEQLSSKEKMPEAPKGQAESAEEAQPTLSAP